MVTKTTKRQKNDPKMLKQKLIWILIAMVLSPSNCNGVVNIMGSSAVAECNPSETATAFSLSEWFKARQGFGGDFTFGSLILHFASGTPPPCHNRYGVFGTADISSRDKWGTTATTITLGPYNWEASPNREFSKVELAAIRAFGLTGEIFIFSAHSATNPPTFHKSHYVTNPGSCHPSCTECQNGLANFCHTCKSAFQLDWTGHSDPKKNGRCLCQRGAINAAGDGCDVNICHETCGSCKEAGADKCYTCATTSMIEGTRADDGTLASCTPCSSACSTCAGPNANECTACSNTSDYELANVLNGVGTCQLKCHSSCGSGQCSAAHQPDKCTACPNTADWELIEGETPGQGTCRRKCHSSCAPGQCSQSHAADKCTSCLNTADWNLVVGSTPGEGACQRKCHASCPVGECTESHRADKCTSCRNTLDWDLVAGSTPGEGTCRRKCHSSCAPGQCSQSHLADKCTGCPNTIDWILEEGATAGEGRCKLACDGSCATEQCTQPNQADKCLRCKVPQAEFTIVDPATSTGTCVSCYETCDTCSENRVADRCLTCRAIETGGSLELINGECRCPKGTYLAAMVGRKARCLPCHPSCEACTGPASTQCTSCKSLGSIPKFTTGSSGSCVEVYDGKGKVKAEFTPNVITPTIKLGRIRGINSPSGKNYKAGGRPQRTSSGAEKELRKQRRYVVPLSLPSKTISTIAEIGSRFKYSDIMSVAAEDGLEENKDYTVGGGVPSTKEEYDLTFTVTNPEVQAFTARITFINNNYFFNNLPPAGSSRNLQELTTTNADLLKKAPLISNTSLEVSFTAQDYSEGGVDFLKVLGVILRVIIILAVISATAAMIVLLFTSKQTKSLVLGRYLEFIFSIFWIVKVGLTPALFSLYELVFIDEVVRADTLLMVDFEREGEIRGWLKWNNKFYEYSVPVLLVNSAGVWIGILVVCLFLIMVAKGVFESYRKKSQNQSVSKKPKNEITTQQKKAKEQSGADSKNPVKNSPFLQMVWMSFALITPNIFFYSALGVCWTSIEGVSGSALVSSVFSWILVIIISVVLFTSGVYFFSKKFMSESDNKHPHTQRKLMDLTVLSGNVSSAHRNNLNNGLRNNKKNEKKVCSEEQAQVTIIGGLPISQESGAGGHKFQVRALWISVLRFSIMMVVIISLQNERKSNLISLVATQLVILVAYLSLCLFSKKRLGGFRIIFEIFVTLLLATLLLMETPSNRVKGNFINNFLTFSLVILIYGCGISKTIEFFVELKSWKKSEVRIAQAHSIEKSELKASRSQQAAARVEIVGKTGLTSEQEVAQIQSEKEVDALFGIQNRRQNEEKIKFKFSRGFRRQVPKKKQRRLQ